jgi:hypothetical protein
MSANTPLLTDTSRLAAIVNAEDFAAGVANHINGDWGGHVQIQVINENWVDSGGNFIPGSQRLRILVTQNGTNLAMVVPVIAFSAPTTGNAPAIVTQPVSQTVVHGSSAIFNVVASGSPVITYRWRFNGVVIPGAVSSQFVLGNVGTLNAGVYDCIVSNPFGFTVTAQVQLFVT